MRLAASLAAGALIGLLPVEAEPVETKWVFEKTEMASPFRITLYASSEEAAQAAVDAAFARVEQLNAVLTDYDSDSELSRLSRTSGQGRRIPVSTILWTVLEKSQEIAELTSGAFDVTVGPLVNLWRNARRKKQLPSPEVVSEMLRRSGYKNLKLDASTQSVELALSEMRLDVGGIAKGYAADEALAVLRSRGLSRALVAASGDLVAGDPPPGQDGWSVAISSIEIPGAPAPEVLKLANRGISSSGDAYQFLEVGGVRYSHVIDPRTGAPVNGRTLVTVIAANGITADGLDTPIDVLGPERGLEIISRIPGACVRILREVHGAVEAFKSPDWPGAMSETISRPAK